MDKHYLLRKKMLHSIMTVVSFLLVQQHAFSQQTEKFYRDDLFKKYADTSNHPFTAERPYYILTWVGSQPESFHVVRKLDEGAAIVTINNESVLKSLIQPIQIAPATDQWKFSPFAETVLAAKPNKEQEFILSAAHANDLIAALKKINESIIILSVDRPSASVLIKSNPKTIKEKLLPLKEVIFIDVKEKPHAEIGIIGYNRSFHGINSVDYSIPGANGKNIVAGVKEQKMQEADIDLYKRVLPSSLAATNVTNHATVVSSIIGGAGNSFYNGRGIAYSCKFFPSSFDNLFADAAVVLNSNRVTVQNHSYGTLIQQFYGAEAVSYDAQLWQNKNMLHVFSAGNSGTFSPGSGPYTNISGYANITGNFKMAKNVITVGAIDNKGFIPAESSGGPLYDGRVAPQLIGLGPNGTSDAAAVVSGTIAVLQQVYADSNSQTIPSASLVKAVLYNSAEDVYNTGIDYKTGYGLLNSYAAIKTIQQKNYDGSSLFQGQEWTRILSVPSGIAQLKVTLAWTDTAAQVNNNKAIINDIDLEIQELNSGTIYKPWVLSVVAHTDSLNKLPTRKRDSLNTAEQISIQLPAAGNYLIKVIGTTISNAPLPFHVSFNIDTLNTFHFTSPQHASDVNRQENENLDIRWKTFVGDTNQTGNLFISYNNGADWQLLKAAHKIYSNLYHWPIKDTATTAILKMETGFGIFLSKDFIISKVNRPNVDFLCTDSFGLSWNKHVYANSYKIYTQTDSAYLKHILTVTDTFVVLKRSLYPTLIYAVEPVLTNNLPAARSLAINFTLQGVKCFYKTFYYTLQDGNRLDLVLELSAATYVDSVFYEMVTAIGQLIRTAGGIKITAANNQYHQLVTDVPQGSSNWRARIKLKTGAILYTEIISVLTSGKKYILFYPNPAHRSSPLNWILQQGIPSSSQLQLFDITGRLLKSYTELPVNIDFSAFAPGVIIYKLLSKDNMLIEKGKIVVQ